MKNKPLRLVLGIIFCVLGVMLFIRTEVLFFLCGVGIIVYGISRLIEWGRRRKTGTSERWALIGGIAAIAVGLAAFVGGNLGVVAVYIVILIISIWISVAGVIEVLGAIMYRRAMTTIELGTKAPGSLASIILGVGMVAIGVLGIIKPEFAVVAVGIILAIGLIIQGLKYIISVFPRHSYSTSE